MRRLLLLSSLLAATLLSACNLVITPVPPGATSAPTTTTATETETMTTTVGATLTPVMTGTAAMTETSGVTATPVLTGTDTSTGTTSGEASGPTASAQLQDMAGNRVGTATFTENSDGSVSIEVVITGFTAAMPGEHGIHIHQVGKCTPDFTAAGDHFNPTDASHGLKNAAGPHAGDLPNLVIDSSGNASYSATDNRISLSPGPNAILDADGSALVIHADPDDQMTDPAGNSGGRIACGVITRGQ